VTPKEKGVILNGLLLAKIAGNSWSFIGGFVCGDHGVAVFAKHSLGDYDTLLALGELPIVASQITVYLIMLIIQIHGFSFLEQVISQDAIPTKIKIAFVTMPAFHASRLIEVGDASKAALKYGSSITSPARHASRGPLGQLMLVFTDL
jgi:hypothetical protein